MTRSPLLSNIGSLLTAWFGAAAAATLALVIMFIVEWGLRDLATLLPTALLTFMLASFCALPIVFLLVIVLLVVAIAFTQAIPGFLSPASLADTARQAARPLRELPKVQPGSARRHPPPWRRQRR